MHVYTGGYTETPLGTGAGISLFSFSATSGELSHLENFPQTPNPAYLALSTDGSHLYAIGEIEDGIVASFNRDRTTGHLTYLNSCLAHGSPCHLSLDATGRFIFVANYGGGTVAVLPINHDGFLSPASCVVQHEGSSVSPERQQEPHPHMIAETPDHRYVLASDLGADKVVIYRLDGANGALLAENTIAMPPGAGPRHFAWTPSGLSLFVLNELDSTLSVIGYDSESGVFLLQQTESTLPTGFTGESTCAHLVVSQDGRFVYASNRGHDSITTFQVQQDTGKITPVTHTPTEGRTPRHFAISPGGRWLLAANQDSNTITTFAIDQLSGVLRSTGIVTKSPAPACVLFAPRPTDVF